MPLAFALLLANATATVGVSAYVPPNCGYNLSHGTLQAWCNAASWSVVARQDDGSEAVVWQGRGVSAVTLPAAADASYRVDFDY